MVAPSQLLVLAALALLPGGAASGEWEWGGVFELTAGEVYTWSAARGKEGAYADAGMKMVMCVPSSGGASAEGLEAAEEAAEVAWDQGTTSYALGSTLTLPTTGCITVQFQFDAHSWVSLLRLNPPASGAYAFFCEHMPIEFENEFHYLRDEHGEDVEPAAEEAGGHGGHAEEEPNRWGLAIGGSFLTALPGLLMIVMVGPGLSKWNLAFDASLFSFASGVIASAAVLLILPEALHLTGDGVEEVTGTWTWGFSFLLGWFCCVAMHHAAKLFGARGQSEQPAEATKVDVASAEEGVKPAEEKEAAPKKIDWSVALPVLFGDFLHNLVDGMVVGFSAKLCDVDTTWVIIGATVAHEAPQEVSDFIILIKEANMKWIPAALLNFAAALGAVLGAIIAYGVEVSNMVQGMCLSFSGGVYLFVAISELAPRMLHGKPSASYALQVMGSFALGAISIGLVLLNHKHCEAGGHGH